MSIFERNTVMKFVTPEVDFERYSSIDVISSSQDDSGRQENTGYTDPDGSFWTPRY